MKLPLDLFLGLEDGHVYPTSGCSIFLPCIHTCCYMEPMQHVYPSNMSFSSTMTWICHYTDITSNIQQGFGSATEPRCPHVCISTCYSSSFPPEKLRKMPLSGIEFLGAGILRITCDLANTTLEETFPGGVYLPMFWKVFVTPTTGCVMNFILRDIEGYWGWLLKELLLVFPHLSVCESAAALHQLNEFCVSYYLHLLSFTVFTWLKHVQTLHVAR